MKITWHGRHLSILSFDPIELPDFSIITGKNGTGKTHFLEGIARRAFRIKEGSKNLANLIYFNYNDFIVKKSIPQVQRNQVHRQPNPLIKVQDQKIIQQNINEIRQLYQQKLSELEKVYKDVNHSLYKAMKLVLIDWNLEFIDYIPTISETLSTIKKNNPSLSFDKSDAETIYEELVKTLESLKDIKEFRKFYNISKTKNIHLNQLQASDLVYNESFLGSQLEDEFKKYKSDLLQSYVRIAKRQWEQADCKIDFEKEKLGFETIHGEAPWELINSILNVYGCNDYFFSDATIPEPPSFPADPKTYKIDIVLKNMETGAVVNIDVLSSGEKTLFALALTVYQQIKNGNLPEVLLLDEIDSSLHPSMAKQLLDVLKKVFIEEYGLKIILVTHSPSTIAHADEEDIYIMHNGAKKHHLIKESKESALRILSDGFISYSEEKNNLSISYNIENSDKPVLMVEGITDKIILETAWKKLNQGKTMPFYIQDFFDCYFIQNTFLRNEMFNKYSNKIFVGMLDFDSAAHSWNRVESSENYIVTDSENHILKNNKYNAFLTLLPVPESRKDLAHIDFSESYLSIEHFFPDSVLEGFLIEKQIAGGGVIHKFNDSKKTKFAKKVNELGKNDFKNFVLIFEKIEGIINPKNDSNDAE